MMRVTADLDACQGYANCVVAADDYFDIDDDGIVVILREDVPESELKRVTDAVHSCPVSALRIES